VEEDAEVRRLTASATSRDEGWASNHHTRDRGRPHDGAVGDRIGAGQVGNLSFFDLNPYSIRVIWILGLSNQDSDAFETHLFTATGPACRKQCRLVERLTDRGYALLAFEQDVGTPGRVSGPPMSAAKKSH
jgi:hypothetical protein